MSVPRVRVAELAVQVRGVSYAKEEASLTPQSGLLPVLRANNITEEGLSFDDLVFVPVERIAERQRLCRNDVIIAASSGSLDVVGKAAPVLTDFNGGFGAFCKVLRPGARVHPGYFAHFFKTRDYRQRMSQCAAGASINNLRNEHLDELEIPLPAMLEQRRIAEILNRAEALQAKRRAAIAHLDVLEQSIFLGLFGDPVENSRGFLTRRLIELVDASRGISYGIVQRGSDVDNGVPVVRIGDVVNGEIVPTQLKRTAASIAGRHRRTTLRGGELVISIRGTVGRCAVVPIALSGGNITRELALIPLVDLAQSRFLLALLRSEVVQRRIFGDVKGIAQRGINLEDLRGLPIIQPPIAMVREFDKRSEIVKRLKTAVRESYREAGALIASLQHQAFRGEL